MDHSLIVPVTDELADELHESTVMSASLRDRAEGPLIAFKPTDVKDYGEVTSQLNRLVLAVLKAQLGVSLVEPLATGARFDVHRVRSTVDAATSYLKKTAVKLRGSENLSRRDWTETREALGHLRGIIGSVLSAIQAVAQEDLDEIRKKGGIRGLMAAAHHVSETASVFGWAQPDAPDSNPNVG